MTYYWETENGHGSFYAQDDEQALKKIDKDTTVILYRENNETEDGTPFVILHVNEQHYMNMLSGS